MQFSDGNYPHIRNYYLSNSTTFQDGNGNGNFWKINSNDFEDGKWEPMEMKGATADARTVTVMVIKRIHPNFKTVTVTVILGKSILKSNKTAGNNFDSNGYFRKQKFMYVMFWLECNCTILPQGSAKKTKGSWQGF